MLTLKIIGMIGLLGVAELAADQIGEQLGIGSLAKELTPFGFLIWFAYYNTAVAGPRAHDKFDTRLAATCATFADDKKSDRDEHAKDRELFRALAQKWNAAADPA